MEMEECFAKLLEGHRLRPSPPMPVYFISPCGLTKGKCWTSRLPDLRYSSVLLFDPRCSLSPPKVLLCLRELELNRLKQV
ncbi:Protein of unknown function [Gryllus bimaculatus]|nr:Protein of unknown function [Gryllus bimaculatus]